METTKTLLVCVKSYKPRRKSFFPKSHTFSLLLLIYLLPTCVFSADDECPWIKDPRVPGILKSQCQCVRAPSANSPLSIQCHDIEASELVAILAQRAKIQNLELLYLNASRVTDVTGKVPARIFKDVKIVSLQMSGCRIKGLHPEAFRGQQNTLKHLSLMMNQLKEVPKAALDKLKNLSLLDLSHNRIIHVRNKTFERLPKLSTLKLNDNNLQLETNAFKGLESSLKNLNLKATRISTIPDAIRDLSMLAFLDLAQNRIRQLDPIPFANLHSLTALNLERNLLQTLPLKAFANVNDTLSSLSLLNNLITTFPKTTLEYLHELKVLDLGFNLLTELPENAFEGLHSLTLLALDGNPLATLPAKPFSDLNKTLRGLSLGGRFLHCDCRIRWILDWVELYDLQVTSRERNPQFCGNPPELRRTNFYDLKYKDFPCEVNETISTSSESTIVKSTVRKVSNGQSFFDNEDETAFKTRQNLPTTERDDGSQDNYKIDSREHNRNTKNGLNRYQNSQIRDVLEPKSEKSNDPDMEPFHVTGNNNTSSLLRLRDVKIEKTENKPITLKPFVKRISLIQPINLNQSSTPDSTTKKIPPAIKAFTTHEQVHKSPSPVKSLISTTSSTSTIVSYSNSKSKTQSSTPNTSSVETTSTKKPVKILPSRTDFDESEIPTITGVGGRISSNPNPGSVIPVRVTPTPTTRSSIRIFQKSQPTTTRRPDVETSETSFKRHQDGDGFPIDLVFAEKSEIVIDEIERNGDSVSVHWESMAQYGFRIIYRIFGEDTFRHGPPLAPTEREYRIQNVPHNECIVVCVVPYEEIVYNEISTSATTVPPGSQCKELKPASLFTLMNHMDKVTIGATAAICFTVLVAIFIFISFIRRAKQKREETPIISKVPHGAYTTPSPGLQPIIPSGSTNKEWDQLSGVSSTIPRPRIYSGGIECPAIGTGLSRGVLPVPHSHSHHNHHQHFQSQRPVPEGHSTHKSYLSSSHSHLHYNNSTHNYKQSQVVSGISNSSYLNNQSRLLRASLGPTRSSQEHVFKQFGSSQMKRNTQKKKKEPRMSTCDSLNTLSGYDTPPDNWTDHDMDVYVAQNATRRNLVQL